MDMLVVGMYGGSNSDWIGHGLGGCTDTQYKTHFALWAFMGSNLMIGCDIRNLSPEMLRILTCKGLIEINQDGAYRQPWAVPPSYPAVGHPLKLICQGGTA